jgi:hypothetical protein
MSRLWSAIVCAVEEHALIRRLLLVSTCVLTAHGYMWAMDYADRALASGADLGGAALVIGAVLAPASVLLGAISSHYHGSRRPEQ